MNSAVSTKSVSAKPSYLRLDRASYPWKAGVNYRNRPKLYRVGRGEQGVLICEPFKSELTPYWRFKTPTEARRSARKIFFLFESYLDDEDLVGADMARKFLQMGYPRARRYANYKGGNKYDKANGYASQGTRHRRSREGRKCRDIPTILQECWSRAALRRS